MNVTILKQESLILFSLISLLVIVSPLAAQEKKNEVKLEESVSTGTVSFDLSAWRDTSSSLQELTLYGCNTSVRILTNGTVEYIIGKTVESKQHASLTWGKENQIVSGIPYGVQGKGKNQYYVSKYYMASPPIFPPVKKKDGKKLRQKVDIGLVLPDRFTFFGNQPVQLVNLDYAVLEPVYLNFVGFNYDYVHTKKNIVDSKKEKPTQFQSCHELGVDVIPINIQCDDFKWVDTNGISSAEGASGIARLKKDQPQLFLPSYEQDSASCLNCEITVLDDIIKDYEVFFALGDSIYKSMSFTQFYNDSIGKSVNLFCRSRQGELPLGCRKNNGQDRKGYIFEE